MITGFFVGDKVLCGAQSVEIVALHQNGDVEVKEPDGQIAITRIERLSRPKSDLSSLLASEASRTNKSLNALLGD
jgi:hypothetical protein